MIGKTKPPFSVLKGTIGHSDRTIGIDKALAVNFQDRKTGMILSQKTTPNRAGSQARHDRATVYCNCDIQYKMLSYEALQDLKRYQRIQKTPKWQRLNTYQFWMALCMANQKCLWLDNSTIFTNTLSYTKTGTTYTFSGQISPAIDNLTITIFKMESLWGSTQTNPYGKYTFQIDDSELIYGDNQIQTATCKFFSNLITITKILPKGYVGVPTCIGYNFYNRQGGTFITMINPAEQNFTTSRLTSVTFRGNCTNSYLLCPWKIGEHIAINIQFSQTPYGQWQFDMLVGIADLTTDPNIVKINWVGGRYFYLGWVTWTYISNSLYYPGLAPAETQKTSWVERNYASTFSVYE